MTRSTCALLLAAFACLAHAQQPSTIYGCVDASGHRYYTNVKADADGKKCAVVQREVSVVPATPVPRQSQSPAGTKVQQDTQKARDDARRRILQEELENADKALSAAKQKLAEQESTRSGDERNYQRVLDRLKPFQQEVERQQENVAQLKRELSNLR